MRKVKFFLSFIFVLSCIFITTNFAKALSQSDWSQINTDGFGDVNSNQPYDMITFNDELYVAVSNGVTGAEIHKYNGTSWNQINVSGFGEADTFIYDLIEFSNELYAGTGIDEGKVYKYSGSGTSWSKVSTDGFGDIANDGVTTLFELNSNLYAGTDNTTNGAEVWRYSGSGTNWTQIAAGGINDANNRYFIGTSIYNGRAYTGTRNGITGGEVFSYNGTTWTQINTDGFDNSDNYGAFSSTVYNNELYFGTLNSASGAEVWKYNGSTWTRVANGGLGDPTTIYTLSFEAAYNGIYVGFGSILASKGKVYFYNGSTWTQQNDDGFGDAQNIQILSLELFRGTLYAGAAGSTAGAEIWAAQTDSTNPTISNQSPADNEDNVDLDSDINFRVNDENSGINSSTIDITIEGSPAMINGACQTGYSCALGAYGSNGYTVSINPSVDFDYSQEMNISVSAADYASNTTTSSWSFTTREDSSPSDGDSSPSGGVYRERNGNLVDINPNILTTSGPGEITRLWAYDRRGNETDVKITSDLFPDSYTGGAGIVAIDQNNNYVRDQFLFFATSNGGPQARVMGLKEDGSTVLKGQMFVFQAPDDASNTSSIRDGLSATVGDFDNDGFQDDAAFCLTGDYTPHIKIYTDVTGIDSWNLLNQFTVPIGPTGCNLGTFQYDTDAPELLITPHHGPTTPTVYIYTVGGTLKQQFQAYDDPIDQGLTATSVNDRIYTTPNNGSSHVRAFDREGNPQNFWWVYQQHVRGDFTIRAGDIDLDNKDELITSPIGANGPHVLAFEPTNYWRTWPNFFAFGDETLRNGVGIAVIENWHGVN